MPKLFSCHKKGSSTVGNPRISAQKTLLSSIPGGFFSTSGRYMSTSSADSLADKGQQQQAPPPPAELSKANQLKAAVKDYGSTVIVFHVAISLASLAGFYAAVSSGLDVVGLVGRLPFVGEKVASSGFGAGASTFVLAYAVHKAFAPVRISITLTATPFIVKYLRRKGILKMKQKLP